MSEKVCMVVVANPNPQSLTFQLVEKFMAGLKAAGHKGILGEDNSFSKKTINQLFQNNYPSEDNSDDLYRKLLSRADGVCLAFPWWCEMPPYPLVAWMQRNLIKDVAYLHDGVTKTPILNLPTQLLVTMGQTTHCNLQNIKNGLAYTGLHCNGLDLIVQGAGPNLTKETIKSVKEEAYQLGKKFFK